jgi:hypothetical protein
LKKAVYNRSFEAERKKDIEKLLILRRCVGKRSLNFQKLLRERLEE